MSTSEKLEKLISLLNEIKSQLDHECCQTLMDADSLSAKIEETLREIID
tara:strand:- start:125 stop:271 length:147 start_codon:yes stop_codon:yes gene_type:complete